MIEKDELRKAVKTGYGVAYLLRESGVSKVFGIPDGHTLAFYDGLRQIEGIDHILVADERTAAFAADAYARVTGGVGVCDAGPAGSMNFPVALAEAEGFGSPMLALVGVVNTDDVLRNIPHDINVTDTLKGVTKWAEKVYLTKQVPRFTNYALRMAKNGKYGPVALVVPEDILSSKDMWLKDFIPKAGGACSVEGCEISPTENEIDVAVQMILKAEQPIIYAGGLALTSGAFSEIKQLSEMLHIPVFANILGKGIMLEKHDNLYFGTIGLFGEKPSNVFTRSVTDLVIAVGNRLTEDDTAKFKFPPTHKKMVQIDIDPAEIGLSYDAWGVVGDPKMALQMIIERLKAKEVLPQNLRELRTKHIEKLRKKRQRYKKSDRKKWMNAEPIKPQRVLYTLNKVMDDEDYLVTDASASARWIGVYFPAKKRGRHIITPRGVGPTGFGLGGLLGVTVAVKEMYGDDHPNVVMVTGDGGLMNAGLSDIETLVQYGLRSTIIVLNNAALGFVKFGQMIMYQRNLYNTERPKTDFARIAESLGAKGYTIKTLDELDSQIPEIINKEGVKLVNVYIDPNELLPPNFY